MISSLENIEDLRLTPEIVPRLR